MRLELLQTSSTTKIIGITPEFFKNNHFDLAALQPGKWLVTVLGVSADAGVIRANILCLAVRFLK